MGKDCYLSIGDNIISIREIADKFGIDLTPDPSLEVALRRRVEGGTLMASTHPEVDESVYGVCLYVDFVPDVGNCIPLSTTDCQEGEPLRTYLYGSGKEYIAYTDHDTRSRQEAEAEPRQTRITVSGNPNEIVGVVQENPYVRDEEV